MVITSFTKRTLFGQVNRKRPMTSWVATTSQIQAVQLEQLEALANALLDFTGQADLATWLGANT
jgi:hypothetical protein